MKLYHGSFFPGLTVIRANAVSHATGRQVAYFTDSYASALIYCRRPEENFVTAGIRPDGKQHYFERFPRQLETLYQGLSGHIYSVPDESGFTHVRDAIWEREEDVPVSAEETVPDVYAALLSEIGKGTLVLHRYGDIDPEEQRMMTQYFREHIAEMPPEMQPFYRKHFFPREEE